MSGMKCEINLLMNHKKSNIQLLHTTITVIPEINKLTTKMWKEWILEIPKIWYELPLVDASHHAL